MAKNRGLEHNEERTAMPRVARRGSSYENPGREKGSRTVNSRSRTPTSIQDTGKSTFGPLKGGYGDVDDGDGTGIDCTYKRG